MLTSMIIDGKRLAEEIKISLKDEIIKIGKSVRLAVIYVGENPVTEKFLEQKKKFGEAIGVNVRVYKFAESISTTELRKKVAEIAHNDKNTAVIIQLPLPTQIKTEYILDGIVPEKDADMLSSKSAGLFSTGRSQILPPVVGAIKLILEKNNIGVKGKNTVVLGAGRLVGRPVATWLTQHGATVTACDEHTKDISQFTKNADIIVSGVGKPKIVTFDMVKDGVVAIDAGASESAGKIMGDMDPEIAKKASFFVPVPGGVGPLTVAMLFSNVVVLAKK